MRHSFAGALLLIATVAAGQSQPHDITQVDPAPPGGSMAVPLPQAQAKRLRKYEIPELVGTKQALGSQLIDGRLPRPLVDLRTFAGPIEQRLSIFERGLVVISMNGAGGLIRKKMIIPDDALTAYLKVVNSANLGQVAQHELSPATGTTSAQLRVYANDGQFVERRFDPTSALPKPLQDEVLPLQDLLRTMSEDRTVTNTIAGYDPQVGDELVGDDRKTWKVVRVIEESNIVVLHCTTDPTTIYVGKKDLYNYFIGAAPTN
ncbi:MAG TPA: hypothetical protein VII75_07855 [Thermoanaerobaculia bacterium]|nr:hypothetical protein [Thermoanaerobaculia bacterium]